MGHRKGVGLRGHRKNQLRACFSVPWPACGRPERQTSVTTKSPPPSGSGQGMPPRPRPCTSPPAFAPDTGSHIMSRTASPAATMEPSPPARGAPPPFRRTSPERRRGGGPGPHAIPGEVPAASARVAGRVAEPHFGFGAAHPRRSHRARREGGRLPPVRLPQQPGSRVTDMPELQHTASAGCDRVRLPVLPWFFPVDTPCERTASRTVPAKTSTSPTRARRPQPTPQPHSTAVSKRGDGRRTHWRPPRCPPASPCRTRRPQDCEVDILKGILTRARYPAPKRVRRPATRRR